MLRRLVKLKHFLTGQCIVIYHTSDGTLIDKGKISKNVVYDVAVDFFHKVYTKA